MKLIKIIGRILLIVAGIWLLAQAIPIMIPAINNLNSTNSWWNFGDVTARDNMVTVLGQGINALGGVIALLAALIGKKSMLLGLYAILMMVAPVYTVVTGVQHGTITGNDWNKIWMLVGQFACPIIYFVGFLLV